MADVAASSYIKGSFVEDENKVDIEATTVNLDCVKSERNEATLDFEEGSDTRRYKITLEYENIFGESSHQIKIEEDYDNLIGFRDNNVIMENAMIKLEAIKEEDDGSFNNIYCSKCKRIYKGYCLQCSSLLRILNNNLAYIKSESNTIPTDILEIRETSMGKGVYLLRTLSINIIFGPFEGILGIESTVGHSWKIIDNKLRNSHSGNWMRNIVCAASASLRNLDIFQIDGNLYFQTSREITEGEELLIYYDDEELQQLDNSEECLYTPKKQHKLPKIFACTMCCLGFGSNVCLVEHKRKCCRMEDSRSKKDFVLVECHYCKMWMEKWEHEEYHVAYCLEKHHRMWSDRSGALVEEMIADCDTKDDKRRYRRDICSRPMDRRSDLQSDATDYQHFSGRNHETRLNECALVERSNNEQAQNIIEINKKIRFQNHLNKHRGIKCDICMAKFTEKCSLKRHIRNKHTDDGGVKDYKCAECSYQTNYKSAFQFHINKHRGVKPFTCDICMMKFGHKENLKMHIRNKHTDDGNVKDYNCSECCSYQTNYKKYFQFHINMHRGIKPFTCDICMMKFGQKENLKTHIRNKHTNNGSAKDYKCSECSYQSNYKSSFQVHINKHRGVKPFTCDICMMTFTRKNSLKKHIRNKHTDYGSVKDYKCSECAYQTNCKSHLKRHLNTHTGIKPFRCDICMTKFTEKGSLKTHIKNKHTNDGSDKDYKCSECSFHANDKSHLERHLNTHKVIKPFTCDICMMTFRQKRQLKMHIRNKHTDDRDVKDYKCLACSYQTNDSSNFHRHLNKHRRIKAFKCDICMAKFTQKGSLNTHIKNKHTDDISGKD